MNLNFDELNEYLKNGKVVVEFNKKNGELRKMICTKKSDFIPDDSVKTTEKSQAVKTREENNPELFVVWDLEKNGWRSFQFKQVIDYTVMENV